MRGLTATLLEGRRRYAQTQQANLRGMTAYDRAKAGVEDIFGEKQQRRLLSYTLFRCDLLIHSTRQRGSSQTQ